MRGGVREGSGRKTISPEKKKKCKNIYLTDDLIQEINQINKNTAYTFSKKCVRLIEIGISQLRKTSCAAENGSVAASGYTVKDAVDSYQLTFIDLFAGIGGIRKGFEDADTKCVFSSEWDKFAAKTYEANYGEVPFGDITKINAADIPDHDVLLAGFPCQPFSNIGKREGFAHETQGTLFFDVLRILQEKQPKMFLLENVSGLLTNDQGNTFRVIINALEKLKYSIFYKLLDAQNFGLPQRRKRVVIVGFREDMHVTDFDIPEGDESLRVPVKDILEHNPKGYTISKHLQSSYLFKRDDGKPQLIDFNSNIQVNTLCASYHKIQRLTGTFVKDGATGIRLYSELECKRLMGFSDDFAVPVSRTQMYRQFGNSVAVPMIKAVADEMKKALRKSISNRVM